MLSHGNNYAIAFRKLRLRFAVAYRLIFCSFFPAPGLMKYQCLTMLFSGFVECILLMSHSVTYCKYTKSYDNLWLLVV